MAGGRRARELDPVLAHCAFWPGADDPAAVVRWARARELHAGLLGRRLAARDASRRSAMRSALRERVAALAAQTTVLDDAALQAAWRAW